MRVLIAPDKFRGTLTASEAASAIAAGWRRARPGDDVRLLPMADGGEGTLDVLVQALGGELRFARVDGPLGDPVEAAYGLAERAGRRLGLVEMARASGLQLVSESRRRPLRASTTGTGQLIAALCADGVDEVVVSLGGSATTDGGAGMAQALGIHLLDADGRPIRAGGAGLLDLARIDATGLDPVVRRTRFVAAADVDSPLTGPAGASAVYGPQKGASPEDVVVLDRALAHLAAVIARDLGVEIRDLPGAGAAGGLGAGLVAFLGARMRRGTEVVMDAVGFDRRLVRSDVLVTGEGRFDEQSLHGKVVGEGIARGARARVPVVVVAGEATVRPPGVRVVSLAERFGTERARTDAARALEELAAELAGAPETLSSPP